MPFFLLRGIFPAALTGFDRENNLDEEATSWYWNGLSRQGADDLLITLTSSEFIALENQKRVRLFGLAKAVVGGRVPVIYGSGHYSTELTIQLCEAETRS